MNLKKQIALEIARGLYKQQTVGFPLKQLFWECTLRCNFACRHCGSDCKASEAQKDMPFEDFRKVLEDVKQHTDPSKVNIIISGGEPLARKDIAECGRKIYNLGFPWGMVTNAWGLNEATLASLIKAGIHSLTISLDGIGEDHDWMRGKPGAFQRSSAAIKMVADFNKACAAGSSALGFKNLKPTDAIAFDVVSCINKRNVNKLDELKEYLISLGLKNWRIFTIFPVGRAANDPELKLDKGEFHTLMEFIKSTRQEGRINANYACEGFLADYEGEVRDQFFFCNAGKTVASVRADGSVSGCLSIRSDYNQGNIYQNSFYEIWTNKFQQMRNHDWMKTGLCKDCKYWRYCQGNGMHLRDEHGNLLQCNIKKAD